MTAAATALRLRRPTLGSSNLNALAREEEGVGSTEVCTRRSPPPVPELETPPPPRLVPRLKDVDSAEPRAFGVGAAALPGLSPRSALLPEMDVFDLRRVGCTGSAATLGVRAANPPKAGLDRGAAGVAPPTRGERKSENAAPPRAFDDAADGVGSTSSFGLRYKFRGHLHTGERRKQRGCRAQPQKVFNHMCAPMLVMQDPLSLIAALSRAMGAITRLSCQSRVLDMRRGRKLHQMARSASGLYHLFSY